MNSAFEYYVISLIRAWQEGPGAVRKLLTGAGALVVLAGIALGLGSFVDAVPVENARIAAAVLGGAAFLISTSIIAYRQSLRVKEEETRLGEVKRKVEEHPEATQAAWELARLKLEKYLDRNLSQVRAIFWLCLFVMLVGFTLIMFGVTRAFQDPANLNPSLVSSASGVLVSFIGATFLVIYRATMSQAKEYVTILERINAVGMSVQILDTIDPSAKDLKIETTAHVAKQLLIMYSPRSGEGGGL